MQYNFDERVFGGICSPLNVQLHCLLVVDNLWVIELVQPLLTGSSLGVEGAVQAR